ncbi:MAG: glycogen synthase GlgA [Mesorhizobium sp.]
MNVLSVASEIYPIVKTGGLADVTGALPGALAAHGVAVRTLVPGYRMVMAALEAEREVARAWHEFYGGPASILVGKAAGLDLFVLDAPHLFDRPGSPYGDGTDFPDNWRRFAALGRAGAEIAEHGGDGFLPDLVHAHDWQAAMTIAYMRYTNERSVPTVMTVHNLAFQGQFPASIFPLLGLPDAAMSVDGVEYYGGVGFLKAGLQGASAITTVSPTYAQEIRTPEFGMGLDGLLNARAAELHGIVNGIDTGVWDPSSDALLPATYGTRTLSKRERNRAAMEEHFSLDRDAAPILTVISRLTWQKGMDLLAEVLDRIVAEGAKVAVLGSGDHALEGALLAGAARHRGRVGVVIGYNEPLSHLMQAGGDAILVPSRFEPCGLTQLYGLRYGCVPVVARTGGLADTIVDANEAALSAGVATGFQFAPLTADAFLQAIRRAMRCHREPSVWATIQRQGMKADVSWDRSAARYAQLYDTLASDV